MRRKHPKIIRAGNTSGAIYSQLDVYGQTCIKAFNCPTCEKRLNKGDNIVKGSFLHENNNWFIRHKLFCCEDCVPKEIKSK